jgi:hypothetical protein
MFVTSFIETDADDWLAEERDRKRCAHAATRGRSARLMKVAAASPDRPHRPRGMSRRHRRGVAGLPSLKLTTAAEAHFVVT